MPLIGAVSGPPRSDGTEGREAGGALIVMLDRSDADAVMTEAAARVRPGARPITVLVHLSRPLLLCASPFLVPMPAQPHDDELRDEARRTLIPVVRDALGHGRVGLCLTFSNMADTAEALLRERDYAQVLICADGTRRLRRVAERIAKGAAGRCPVEIVSIGVRTSGTPVARSPASLQGLDRWR